MERGGPFTGGENPEDPEGELDDETGASQRGWLSPEDRLWRHPSEVSGVGLPRSGGAYLAPGAGMGRRRARGATLAAGVVGVAAIATTLAVVLAFVDAKPASTASEAGPGFRSDSVPVASTSLTSMPLVGNDVMRLVASVRQSLVGLERVGATTPPHMTGVVLPGGALVVTAASAVAGASQLDVITSTGKRMRGRVVGSDA